MHFSWITAESCESISNEHRCVCPLFQSVHSSPEEFMPSLDSTTRNPWTPSRHFVARSMSLSSHPVSPWMGISSLSSRWDLISKDPSSALLSTTSGTSSPTCTTVTEVIHHFIFLTHHPFEELWLKRSAWKKKKSSICRKHFYSGLPYEIDSRRCLNNLTASAVTQLMAI